MTVQSTQQDNAPDLPKPQDEASLIREKIQQNIVNLITKKLESGEMTEERAKAIAKMTLNKLPEGIDYEQLMKVVPTLDDEFAELKSIIFPIIKQYQERTAEIIKTSIDNLLKQKKYTQALNLVKKAIEFEKQLG